MCMFKEFWTSWAGTSATSVGHSPGYSRFSCARKTQQQLHRVSGEVCKFSDHNNYFGRSLQPFCRDYRVSRLICFQRLICAPCLCWLHLILHVPLRVRYMPVLMEQVLSFFQEYYRGIDHPVCYFSKTFNKHQVTHNNIEKDAVVLVLSKTFLRFMLAPCIFRP